MGTGNNSLSRLYCDLLPFGWTLVRRGWRKGLPKNKAPIWVFCPRMASPRDRSLVENCEKCSHFQRTTFSERLGSNSELKGFKIIRHQYIPSLLEIEADVNRQVEERLRWEKEEALRNECDQ